MLWIVCADAAEDVGEVGFGIDARSLGGLDDGYGVGVDFAASIGACEEKISS